jgi:hypothetical protein
MHCFVVCAERFVPLGLDEGTTNVGEVGGFELERGEERRGEAETDTEVSLALRQREERRERVAYREEQEGKLARWGKDITYRTTVQRKRSPFSFPFAPLPRCLVASLPRCLVASLPRCLVALLVLSADVDVGAVLPSQDPRSHRPG